MTLPRRALGRLNLHRAVLPRSSPVIPAIVLGPRRQHSAHASPPLDMARLQAEMLARPEKLTYDVLSPTPTHLLNVALADFLPAACHPAGFDPASPASYVLPNDTSNITGAIATPPPLPEAHHLVYFPPHLPGSGLLPDGTDPFHSPGEPYGRRMWAGGSIEFVRPLPVARQRAVCRETIGAVTAKGRPGDADADKKIFVDVWRRYGEDGVAPGDEAIVERRSLVFMRHRGEDEARRTVAADEKAPARVVKAPRSPTFAHTLTPTHTLLFHYSALTFNAHQIHLNPEYCRRVEGHRNLLFHGPLSLTLMVSTLRSQLSSAAGERLRRIDYRNLAPLYAEEPLTVCVCPSGGGNGGNGNGNGDKKLAPGERKWDVWVENRDGGLSVKGTAWTASS